VWHHEPMKSLRALPRLFIPGADMSTPFEVPKPEFEKLHNVLRLRSGAQIGVMPNDGTFWVCELDGRTAVPKSQHDLNTEPSRFIALAQALPKGDKLDDVIRACAEVGVSKFIVFPSDRSVVKWEEKKLADKMRRLEALAREASETAFRTRIATIEYRPNLDAVLGEEGLTVLSELEGESRKLVPHERMTLVVGPEGGWSPREVEKIKDHSVSLGPRVLRTEHAGIAAASLVLLG
jgi:16S rRNA (uracil1498-N3)-methyltransferase